MLALRVANTKLCMINTLCVRRMPFNAGYASKSQKRLKYETA